MNEKFNKITDKIKIGLFAGVVAIFFVIGLLFFLRPAVSDAEKRELTKFPTFTVESFASGEWTSQVSLWFADTYPMRELMVSADFAFQEIYGIRNEKVNSEAYVKNDTAYQSYGFNQGETDRYIKLINDFKTQIGNKATVYDLIAPLHYQISPSKEQLMAMLNSPDGKEKINYIYSELSGIKTVDAFSVIEEHNTEYLYYRTDHHWTARGAYYAYVAFCNEKGDIEPKSLSDYKKYEFEGFLGTLFFDNGQPQDMKDNPDFVEAFVPIGTNDLYVHVAGEEKPTKYSGGVVRIDTDKFYPLPGTKYNCFLTSDNPLETSESFYCKIDNPTINDGSSIVVIKESYGNAFVPFLVDHYDHVYIIDYRYWKGHLANFVEENSIDDVLFLNVINITSTKDRIDALEGIIK